MEDPVNRKYPVTTKMLNWLHGYLFEGSDYTPFDAVVTWCAICEAFFFLLRASEYLVQHNRSWSESRVVRGMDLAFKRYNKPCHPPEAEEIVLQITQSKTDQYNAGTIRNAFTTGEVLCPVKSAVALWKLAPERFRGTEEKLPLFRRKDGTPIQRTTIQQLLELSAVSQGIDASKMGSHSLRIGGATALYHTVNNLDVVKRFGRWSSDAFHGYLWEAHEPQRHLAKAMAKSENELTVF